MSQEPAGPSWIDEARAAIASGTSWRERIAAMPALKPREIVALTVLAVAILAGAGFGFMRAMPKAEAPADAAVDVAEPSASASSGLVVYVTGAVRRPGVYTFADGARVIDALGKAGGATGNADLNAMNLAAPLTDGTKLYIPRKGETPPASGGGGGGGDAGGKVNINTATAAELDAKVPGVGPVLAQRIVDYRTQHGPFRSVNDLLKVEGIGQKKFDALKDSVTV